MSTVICALDFYALKHIYDQFFSSCKKLSFLFYFAGLYKRHCREFLEVHILFVVINDGV